MRHFSELVQRLRTMPQRRVLAVAASADEHTLEAVSQATKEGLVSAVLIGDVAATKTILEKISCNLEDFRYVEEADPANAVQLAADMVRRGEVDCIMKGKVETGTLMKVLVNREKGIRKSDTLSLLAFMESPYYHKLFAISDVGLLTYPDKEQKKALIRNAVAAFQALGVDKPKVAILTAVEKVNPKMKETIEAAEIKDEGIEGCILEGPISYDLAMDKGAAGIKGYSSLVAGDADILIVPDIVSGNIAAKSLTVLGGGKTGGVVLGAMVPILLVSRAASAEDKYYSIILASLIGRN